jgi:uncharacterized protein (DUF433 family)
MATGGPAMLDTIERLGGWRTDAAYEIGEAHRLTGVSAASIKRWLRDYPSYIAELKPPWEPGMGRPWTHLTRLSFLELVEVLVAGNIRTGKVGGYQEVRRYHDGLAAEWGTQFPFAHENLLTHKERLPGAAVKVLGQVDYEDSFASRWCPLGKDGALALDPKRAGGQPAIKGRRLRVLDIRGQFKAGESVSSIAKDFDLDPAQVESALRFAFFTAT